MSHSTATDKRGLVPLLPKIFIVTAFVNFVVGTLFGVTMTMNLALAPVLAPLHAILNPFGWLTMLIYGMTFAVLFLSLGVQLPTRWQGPTQWAIGEVGIVISVLGRGSDIEWMVLVGAYLMAATPVVFLVNILSGVIYTKRLRRDVGFDAGERQSPFKRDLPAARLFGRREAYRRTDRVGQRGTDVSLMLFIVAAVWAAVASTANDSPSSTLVNWIVYYGWIGGTVLSVAVHLAPRFVSQTLPLPRLLPVLQGLWFGGVFVEVIGNSLSFPRIILWAGQAAVGFSLAAHAALFLFHLLTKKLSERHQQTGESGRVEFRGPPTLAWSWAWSFAFLLGVQLIFGIDAFSLTSIHFLFLGFITSLVFSVGYTVFPLILRRPAPTPSLMVFQFLLFTAGVIVLITALYLLETGRIAKTALATGGILTMVGVFLFFWLWTGSSKRKV